MIEINEESLKFAYSKLKKHVYYSNSNYLRDRLLSFEKNIENDPMIFKKMSNDLLLLSYKNYDLLKDDFPRYVIYPKKDSFKDVDTHTVSIEKVNAFIDMDIKFFLIDVLFCMKLINIYKGIYNDLFFGNLVDRRLLEYDEDTRLKNDLLFEKYWPNYLEWKKSISKKLTSKEIKNTTLIKLDFHRCFYQTKFNIDSFLSKYELSTIDPIIKIALNVYRAYSFVISQVSVEPKEKNIVQLPIGLPSSSIIQNILFSEFDNRIVANENTIRYGRYVDDILLLVKKDLTKEEFVNAYNDIFDLENGEINCAKVNTIFMNPIKLNPKKIEIKPGSTLELLKSEIDRILLPSMLDFWNEEVQEDELYVCIKDFHLIIKS